MPFFAFLLFLPVLPFQILGYTGTCSQNDTDPFLAGVVLSAPLALTSLILTAHASRKRLVRRSSEGLPGMFLSSAILLALAAFAVFMNLGLVKDTLLRGLSPCGADHTANDRLFELEHVLIGCAYGVLPALVGVAAAFGIWVALPKQSR